MNILYLKYAVEVEKAGSINKAAENLFMGQPNLSRAIKDLESSLGITIFERTTKGMVITPNGEEFLTYAKKILSQIDMIESLYKNGKSEKQRFSISVPRASYISNAFASFLKRINSDHPAEFLYKETNSMRAIDNILRADYKLGIIRYALGYDQYFKDTFEEKSLDYKLVADFKYVVVMSKDNPLANKAIITYKDLENQTEVAHADPFVPSLPLATVIKTELPMSINRRIFVFERASQFELLSKNDNMFMWVSPIPSDLLERYDLIQKECVDNAKVYRDMLIYRKGYNLTDIEKVFVEELYGASKKYIK